MTRNRLIEQHHVFALLTLQDVWQKPNLELYTLQCLQIGLPRQMIKSPVIVLLFSLDIAVVLDVLRAIAEDTLGTGVPSALCT